MLNILRKYEEEGYEITEYTRDGKTVSHTIKTLISEPIEEEIKIDNSPSLEDKVNFLYYKQRGVI